MSSCLFNGRRWSFPNTRVGCNFNTHQLVRRESFQEERICVVVCDPDICCPIVVVEIDSVIHNDAIGSVWRFPFNEQRVGTSVSHYYTGGGIRRYVRTKIIALLKMYKWELK